MSEKEWYAAEVITTRENREPIEYGLMEAGALGTETDETELETRVTGHFETPVDEHSLRKILCDALRIYNREVNGSIDVRTRTFDDRDWLAEWKKHWQPVEVGRFIIAPPWIESVPPSAGGSNDQIIIRINPGMAFGTGTHETTRLCLKAMEKHFHGGSFLDVGTGTGILAIAAAKMELGPVSISAYDTDAEAIEIAKENAQLNGVADRIEFLVGSVGEQTPSADFVCANLTAPMIVELLPSLLGATCGRLALSGILDSQIELVQSALQELGAEVLETCRDGEWIVLVV